MTRWKEKKVKPAFCGGGVTDCNNFTSVWFLFIGFGKTKNKKKRKTTQRRKLFRFVELV